jgi:hypothetical protein
MTNLNRALAAAVLAGGLATPALAQYDPPQTYPQTYQQTYPGYGYPNQYGYSNGGNVIGQVIDQLLGNRYSVTDRTAVSQCASAAMVQAQNQYRGYGNNGYRQGYGYQQGYAAPAMRVTAITDVQRRSSGLRVKGLIDSGYGGQYGGQYAYQNRGYGDLSFRCSVDYRGVVTNVRISRNDNNGYRRY